MLLVVHSLFLLPSFVSCLQPASGSAFSSEKCLHRNIFSSKQFVVTEKTSAPYETSGSDLNQSLNITKQPNSYQTYFAVTSVQRQVHMENSHVSHRVATQQAQTERRAANWPKFRLPFFNADNC